jgi:hypothetical protein
MAICRNTAGILRGADHPAIAPLIASVIERIEVRRDGITINARRPTIPYRREKCIGRKPADPRGLRAQTKARRFSADWLAEGASAIL